ncbi:MAG: hypothetical protein II928_02635 [Paludibacteraceae bacterium]|nr:hypothetical protein [Paludibacteraceae bacterium]
MKKIYAFMAAALMSVSMFASLETVPTTAVLSEYGNAATDVILCCYFDVAPCNDVVLAGSYNEWSDDPTKCTTFEAVTGYDGWYVASATYSANFQAKPLQLKDNSFSGWDYQAGDKNAWINKGGDGTGTATIEDGYENEANVTFPSAGFYVYEIAYWKAHKTPCVEIPKHKYTIVLFAPECEYVTPAIVGNFDGWAGTEMNKTTYEGDEAYVYVIEDEEEHAFKFFDLNLKWNNELQYYDEENDGWKNFSNIPLPVATKDTTLVFEYWEDGKYQWTVCTAPEEARNITITLLAPEGAPAEGIEAMGDWNSWAGDEMTFAEGEWTVTVANARSTDGFKFRQKGTWDNQIMVLNASEEWEAMGNLKMVDFLATAEGTEATVDLSDPDLYKWTVEAQGIENVTLTEKAQKVVVDGVLYIIRDNKMYNAQGTQVR